MYFCGCALNMTVSVGALWVQSKWNLPFFAEQLMNTFSIREYVTNKRKIITAVCSAKVGVLNTGRLLCSSRLYVVLDVVGNGTNAGSEVYTDFFIDLSFQYRRKTSPSAGCSTRMSHCDHCRRSTTRCCLLNIHFTHDSVLASSF
jgi:hypothetical protein